jgi:hypothetical protein
VKKDADGNEIVEDKVTDDKEEMVDGIPKSVSDAIDKVVDANADDDDDQYLDADDDTKGKGDEKSAEADDNVLDEEDDDTNDGDDDEVNDELDDETVESLKVLGYSKEMVQKLNDIDPDIVKDIASLLETGDVQESSEEDSVPAAKKTEKVEAEGLISDEDMAVLEKDNPAVAKMLKGLSTTVEKLTTSLNTVAEADEVRAQSAKNKEDYENFCDTNKRLDDLAKDHPIFGAYDKLPLNDKGLPDERNRSVKARATVFGQAQALYTTGSFGTFKECLDGAVTLYEGANGEKKALRKVAGELRGRAKQMTTRPNRNKHVKKQPKPGTDAFMEKTISDAFKKAGVEA